MEEKIKDMDVLISWCGQFSGTERYYKHGLSMYKYTDGVQALCERQECFWLLDDLAIEAHFSPKVPKDDISFAVLTVNKDKSATLIIQKDKDAEIYLTKRYNFVDFPVGVFPNLWLQNDVIFLSDEY